MVTVNLSTTPVVDRPTSAFETNYILMLHRYVSAVGVAPVMSTSVSTIAATNHDALVSISLPWGDNRLDVCGAHLYSCDSFEI